MADKTTISWCDSSVNYWWGCRRVSPGCENCYIATSAPFRSHHMKHGSDRRKSQSAVKSALAMNRKPWICEASGEAVIAGDDCAKCGSHLGGGKHHRRRIFSLSLGDWLDDEAPIDWLAEMLDTIRRCDQVIFILCTKRPENWDARLTAAMLWYDKATTDEAAELIVWGHRPGAARPDALIKKLMRHPCALWIGKWIGGIAPQNICFLTSVENQAAADKRIPELLKIPARWRGLSCEPLLGPVEFSEVTRRADAVSQLGKKSMDGIDWLIIGGESGPSARPCNVEWIRSLVKQGQAAGVATFTKQLGANPMERDLPMLRDFALRWDKKGADPSEWPKDLSVQQYPEGF